MTALFLKWERGEQRGMEGWIGHNHMLGKITPLVVMSHEIQNRTKYIASVTGQAAAGGQVFKLISNFQSPMTYVLNIVDTAWN